MLDEVKKDCTTRMQKCVQVFMADLKKMRTGRAHPSLVEHLKINKKDHHSRRGLLVMVGQRKRLLKYLMRKDLESYQSLIKRLGLKG